MSSSWPDGVTSNNDYMHSSAKTLFGDRADRSPIIWTMQNYQMYPGNTAAINGYRSVHHREQKERSSSPTWPRPDSHLASHSKSPYQGRQGPRATPLPETNNASSSERQLKLWPRWREPDRAFVPKQSPQWDWPPAFFLQSLD